MKLRSFVDYESKLLIVSESPINISDISSKRGIRIIPSVQYIVDRDKRKILKPNEWKEHFNYDKIETITHDGKLKEIVQRIHDPENNNDTLNFSLINLETNEYIYKNGSSVAFHEKPRESSTKHYHKSVENRKKYLKSLELGNYPEQLHNRYINQLKQGESIIQYFNAHSVFELYFKNSKYELYKSPKPNKIEQWNSLNQTLAKSFKDLSAFWDYLTSANKSILSFKKTKPWYSTYAVREKSHVIEKLIIEEHNKLVRDKIIPYKSYQDLHNWMNVNFNHELERNIFWQFCSNCRERVFYYPRYPNHACRKCVGKIRDEKGNKLNHRDVHELKYEENKFKLLLKGNQTEVKIYIDNIEYYAAEAKFGGIVYQLKE